MDQQPASSEGYEQKIAWHAMYTDGGLLSQFEGTTENSSETIDKKRLKAFVLTTRDGSQTILTQYVQPGQRLIYRSRNALKPGQGQVEKIHIIAVENENSRHVIFVHESNLTINIGDFGSDQEKPWYYPITRLPHDEVKIGE